jgi:protoporphyrinogen/coproporphyrinogen III oxidase
VALEGISLPSRNIGDQDLTIGDFIQKKFGSDAKLLVSAITAGIFAGDVDKLSMKSCFPDLVRLSALGKGSLVRGMLLPARDVGPKSTTPIVHATGVTFPNGMVRIVEALTKECDRLGVEIVHGALIQQLERREDTWRIITDSKQDSTKYFADTIISTLSPAALSSVLKPRVINELELLKSLIGQVDVAVVNLCYRKDDVNLPPKGFGHLVAEKSVQSQTGCLGVIYDSNAFPNQQPGDLSVVSVMLGGSNADWIGRCPDDQLISLAKSAMLTQLHVGVAPLEESVVLHRNCIPQYQPGHSQAAQATRKVLREQDLIMFGTGVLGAGIADSVGGALIEIERNGV